MRVVRGGWLLVSCCRLLLRPEIGSLACCVLLWFGGAVVGVARGSMSVRGVWGGGLRGCIGVEEEVV